VAEGQAFFNTLRRLAGKHAQLPESVIVTDEIDFTVSSQPHLSGGFADIKPGMYKGCIVAVKTMRVAMTDNTDKIRRVSGEDVFMVDWDGTEISLSNSVGRLSFGTRCPIRTS